MATLKALLIKREGNQQVVYLDKLKRLTVGIGHLVLPADKLKLGDRIDPQRVMSFFSKDTAKALAAARVQARKAKIHDNDFIVYLASVNFQLGPFWYKKFKKTWALVMARDYDDAAVEVQRSKWFSQTPRRVKDFQGALRRLATEAEPEKAAAQGGKSK
ncbi:MAG: hypothetical protein KGL52_17010 [Rhodospirillales bacterium]|jgi:GH24 family phage-related lysozyme (muramidase)|nr:hypothetical protein [Rhodospirillales bacterium]